MIGIHPIFSGRTYHREDPINGKILCERTPGVVPVQLNVTVLQLAGISVIRRRHSIAITHLADPQTAGAGAV
jgi:hypothetical protein